MSKTRNARKQLRKKWLTPTKTLSNQNHEWVVDVYDFLKGMPEKNNQLKKVIEEKNLNIGKINLKSLIRKLDELFNENRELSKGMMINTAVFIKRLLKRLHEVNDELQNIVKLINQKGNIPGIDFSDFNAILKKYPKLIIDLENTIKLQRKYARYQRRRGHQKFKDTTTLNESLAQPKIHIVKDSILLKRGYSKERKEEKHIHKYFKILQKRLDVKTDESVDTKKTQKTLNKLIDSLKTEIQVIEKEKEIIKDLNQFVRTIYQNVLDEFELFDNLYDSFSSMQSPPPKYVLIEIQTIIRNFENSVKEDEKFNEFVYKWLLKRAHKQDDISQKDININVNTKN